MSAGGSLTPRSAERDEPGTRQIPVIHAVTTDAIAGESGFPERARVVMRALGARGALHLRAPGLAGRPMLELALALAPLQRETGCRLVVNDRIDVALVSGAWGGQLTSRSISVADARRVAPHLRLGASVHSVAEAISAEAAGADWLVAGHVFETRSHPGVPGRGVGEIREIIRAVQIPVVAIGGVKPEHVALLRSAGAYGFAAIRGIWESPDAERAATDYFESYEAHGGN